MLSAGKGGRDGPAGWGGMGFHLRGSGARVLFPETTYGFWSRNGRASAHLFACSLKLTRCAVCNTNNCARSSWSCFFFSSDVQLISLLLFLFNRINRFVYFPLNDVLKYLSPNQAVRMPFKSGFESRDEARFRSLLLYRPPSICTSASNIAKMMGENVCVSQAARRREFM